MNVFGLLSSLFYLLSSLFSCRRGFARLDPKSRITHSTHGTCSLLIVHTFCGPPGKLLWGFLGPFSRLFLFYFLRSRCLSSLGASSGRFWVSQMTLWPSKTLISSRRRFRSEDGLESVLGLSWASFGRYWGSLGSLLGSSEVLVGVSRELLGSQGTILGSSWVLLLSFFSALLVRSSSQSFFFMSWGLFGSILGLQDDPPNLKTLDFASDVH